MNLELSNLALHHLIEENQVLLNGFINKVQTTPQGLLKLKIHTKEGDKNVLVNNKAIFISSNSISAKQNPGGFSSFIKKYIFNQRIISLTQKDFDRIVLMEFPSVILIFELFAKGNVILCNKEFKIIRAMKKEKWKDREIKTGEIYKFPSSRGKNPLEIKTEEFFYLLKENEKTIFGSIFDILNVAPGIINYLFEKNNWNKTINASTIDKKKSEEILSEIKKLYASKETGAYVLENTIYSIEINAERKSDNITGLLNENILVNTNHIEKKEIKKNVNRTENYNSQIKKSELEEKEYLEVGEKIYLEYQELQEIIEKIKLMQKNNVNDDEIKSKIKSTHQRIKDINLQKSKLIIEI